MANDRLLVELLISADGAQRTVGDLRSIQQAIADNSSEIVRTAQIEAELAQKAVSNAALKMKALRDVADLAKDLARDTARLASAASPQERGASKTAADSAAKAADLAGRAYRDAVKEAKTFGEVSVEASRKFKAAKEQEAIAVRATSEAARQAQQEQQHGSSILGGGVAEIAFRYNNVVGALQNLRATAQPVYDALIQSNETLNAQILSSQTNLAASTRIFKGGAEVTDPTERIKASAGQLRASIKQIEIDTQELVGVTSAQVNELFQTTLTNAGQLNNQSKEFPTAIAAATSLTKGWAASLQVVGIPLDEARYNINAIIKGQITVESKLAKSLNISNQQVETWRSQGRLVDELNKRLQVFVAGNAIAARSIGGIGSNIRDLQERLTRTIGAPFLAPTIDGLAQVEKFLKTNEQAIIGFFNQLTDELLRQGTSMGEAFAPVGKTLLEIGADLGPIALSALKGILMTLANVAKIMAPLIDMLAQVVKLIADFAATDLGGIVVQTTAVVYVLSQLAGIIVGLTGAALPALITSVLAATSQMLLFAGSGSGVLAASTAAGVGVGILDSAFALLTAESIALTAALIPLTAAIGLAVLERTTKDLEDANEALDIYGKQVIDMAGVVATTSGELEALNKIVAENGTLTDAQAKRQKHLTATSLAYIEGIDIQIKAEKELTNLSKEQAQNRDNNIKTLEALSARLTKANGGIKTESKLLEDLGTTAALAKRKLADFNRQIESGANGDRPAFEAQIKGKIAMVQSEVQLKRMSVEAARKELESIKSNTKADLESRNSAKEAIDKLYDGRIGKIKELIEAGGLEAKQGVKELERIAADKTLEINTRRKASQQIIGIRKEQIAAETAAITAGLSEVATAQAKQRIGEALADEQTTKLKIAEANKKIEAGKVALSNATNTIEKSKVKAEIDKDTADKEKIEADLANRVRKRAIEAFDLTRNLIKVQNDMGLIDRATYNKQVMSNDLAQSDVALTQQRAALEKLGKGDKKGREAINSQIAQLQTKRVEIARAFDDAELKRITERYDQELSILDAAKNNRLISEADFNKQKVQNRIAQADAEIAVEKRELARRGKNDIEGRNLINSQIAQAQSKKIKALEESYATELALAKDAQDKLISIANQSEQQSSIDLARLVNQRAIRQEVADTKRSQTLLTKQKAELKQAQDYEGTLALLRDAARSPEAERAYQQQVREARSKTLVATLNIVQTEGTRLEQLRTLVLKGIEDISAAKVRSADKELSLLASSKGAQERAAKDTEAQATKELAAIDILNKAIERQSSLLVARNNLTKANSDATLSSGDLEIERLNQAQAIRKELKEENLSDLETRIKIKRLRDLGSSQSESDLNLEKRKQALEVSQAEVRLNNLNIEQSVARSNLTIEQQKTDIANRRLIIESKIAEFKAQQAVYDARSTVLQTEQTNRKSSENARLGLENAKRLQPGRERDRAIAEAESKIDIVTRENNTSTLNAAQGVELAQQQVGLAKQNTQAALEQVASSEKIKKLQRDTLTIQQETVLNQFNQVEAAKAYVNQLEKAKAIAASMNPVQPVILPARANGGSVRANQPYLVGENSPEVFVPGASGTILNKEQLMKNFGNLNSLNVNSNSGGMPGNRGTIEAIKSLEQTILSRPPAPIIANFNSPDDAGLDKLFAVQRSSLRIN